MDSSLKELLESCLAISLKDRLTPEQVLCSDIFISNSALFEAPKLIQPETLLLRCPLKHIYYWWQLAGGDVQNELKKEGLIRSDAPILLMPK